MALPGWTVSMSVNGLQVDVRNWGIVETVLLSEGESGQLMVQYWRKMAVVFRCFLAAELQVMVRLSKHWNIVDLAMPLAENLVLPCRNCRSCPLLGLSNLVDPLKHSPGVCVVLQVDGCIL